MGFKINICLAKFYLTDSFLPELWRHSIYFNISLDTRVVQNIDQLLGDFEGERNRSPIRFLHSVSY